jgi:cobalt-zinc-cadmium efflux system membrane fusion protein
MKTNKFTTILLLAAALQGCHSESEPPQQTTRSVEEVISVVEATEGKAQSSLTLSGQIKPNESKMAHVVSPFGGKTQNVQAEIGDEVKKGSVLAVVHSTDAADHLREIQEAEAEKQLAQRDLTMQEHLFEDGLTSEREVAEARTRLHIAKSNLERLQSVANINGYTGQASTRLTSPIDGIVLKKSIYSNMFISAGEEAFVIADLNTVWAVADVYESDIYRVGEGAEVEVEVIAWPGETYRGTIDKIYGALDAKSKTMKVRVVLDNPSLRLRPGMFANIRILPKADTPTLPAVPSSAVVFENGKNFLVVSEEGKFRLQEVEVALSSDAMAYIQSGLNIGQRVVNRNALLIYNELKP